MREFEPFALNRKDHRVVAGHIAAAQRCESDIALVPGTGRTFASHLRNRGKVDAAARGRVMSIYGMVHRGGPALGAVIIGGGAALVGLQAAMIGGGAVTAIVFVLMLRRYRTMVAALEMKNL